MFVPFIVNAADVEIKSITEIERTGDVEVNNEPTFDGMKINFDLAFTNVDDSVTYKVVVKNTHKSNLVTTILGISFIFVGCAIIVESKFKHKEEK